MPAFAPHPVSRLLAWCLALIAVQVLSGVPLLLAAALPCAFGTPVIRRGARLVWRTRWLLVSLFVILAWGTAGDALWASDIAPTREGLREAGTHLGRLVAVLMIVAAFLETMSLPDLLAATHALLAPFRRLGIDSDRGVVRLMLVLRYAEQLPRPRDWKDLLAVPETVAAEEIAIPARAFGGSDLALSLIVALAVGALLWG